MPLLETTFYALLFVLVALYLSQSFLIFLGLRRLNYPRQDSLPPVSVLVAFRDEEHNIVECLESLQGVDYPGELMQIILINDRSVDRTWEMIRDASAKYPQFEAVNIRQAIPGLSGKANAIAQGIERARGEIILVTDGDCRVPTSWARAHVAHFQHDVGLVGGFTLLDERDKAAQLFQRVQSLDWAYLLSIGSGAIGMGFPLSILGNNFSFRRRAYDQVGGYRNMGFTIIEDFALMKTLLQNTQWQIRYPIDRDMLVVSKPMPSIPDFYRQRKRWSAGGKEVGLYGKFLMLISHSVHLLLPLSFFLQPDGVILSAWIVPVLLADLAILNRTLRLVGRRDLLRFFLPWEAFYFVYTTLFAPVLLFPTTIDWKRTSYSWKFNFSLKSMVEKK